MSIKQAIEALDELVEYAEEAGFGWSLDNARAALAALRSMPAEPVKRCPYCDDTGDVHSIDGEWRGTCNCPAGQATPSAPTAVEPTAEQSSVVEPDERADFEAWINRGERSPLTVKDDRGGYLDTPTHFRWTGWQARASKGTK